MPAQSVDPRIDKEREHEAVECAAHDRAGEERQGELDPAHRVTAELTARTYPGGPGVGVDQTSAPSCRRGCGPRAEVSIRPFGPFESSAGVDGDDPQLDRTTVAAAVRGVRRPPSPRRGAAPRGKAARRYR